MTQATASRSVSSASRNPNPARPTIASLRAMGAPAALRQVRRDAVRKHLRTNPSAALSALKSFARTSQAEYVADIANRMARLVDPSHGRLRNYRVQLTPAQRHSSLLPSADNVPSWAAHLNTRGTILEMPTAIPMIPGRTPVKTVVPAPRRTLRCIFCSSPAKERGPRLSYDICSECFKVGKADVIADYIEGHTNAPRRVLVAAVLRVLAEKTTTRTRDLLPEAVAVLDLMRTDQLQTGLPSLAADLQRAIDEAVTDYLSPHPDATDIELAALQPFPVNVAKQAAAFAEREQVQYSFSNDPNWSRAADIICRRESARKSREGRLPDGSVLALGATTAATYSAPLTDRLDDTDYDGFFDDPDLDATGSTDFWTPYAVGSSRVPLPGQNRPLVRTGNRFRNPTAGMAIDRLLTADQAVGYLVNDEIDSSVHIEALNEDRDRLYAEATWKRIRNGDLTAANAAARGEGLFPRLRTASAPTHTSGLDEDAWDRAVDQLLVHGRISGPLRELDNLGSVLDWATEHRGSRLPAGLTDDRPWALTPHPEIARRATLDTLAAENRLSFDAFEAGRMVLDEDDGEAFGWSDSLLPNRDEWLMTNRSKWVRSMINARRGASQPTRRRPNRVAIAARLQEGCLQDLRDAGWRVSKAA